jgi:transposase
MMLGHTGSVRVHAWPAPVDLRRGFDGLYGLVRSGLGMDPLDGDVFLFLGRDARRCKVLHFDGTGLCIYQKRLMIGRFARPWERARDGRIEMTVSELALFLEGCALVARESLSPPRFSQ